MSKIWVFPLEPIDTRYTKQWYGWFKEVMKDLGVNFEYVDGDRVKSNLEKKFFLDPISTHVYKFSQLTKFFKLLSKGEVKRGDICFFFDLWFDGLESLQYLRKMADFDLKIAGVLHAGSYDPWDLLHQKGLEYYFEELENSWLKFIDKIFVASNWHKELLTMRRKVDEDKIIVSGLPVDVEGMREFYSKEREDYFVFTGRLSIEKGIDVIDKLLKQGLPIIKCLEKGYAKKEYYKVLSKARGVIAPSRQETFGYGVVEGMALDITPIVPDKLSFVDYVPRQWRYRDEFEMMQMIEEAKKKQFNFHKYVQKYQYQKVIKNMVRELD